MAASSAYKKADGEACCAAALFSAGYTQSFLQHRFHHHRLSGRGIDRAAFVLRCAGLRRQRESRLSPRGRQFPHLLFQRPLRIPLPEKAGVRSVLTEFSSMQKGAADRKSAAPLICFSRRTYLCTRPEALPPIRDLTSSTVTMLKSPSMVCFSAEAAAA